jgi:molecular chaperone GrpE (heat shock protein)
LSHNRTQNSEEQLSHIREEELASELLHTLDELYDIAVASDDMGMMNKTARTTLRDNKNTLRQLLQAIERETIANNLKDFQ